jgi:outer membrane lipoprotein-sorting protein
MLSRLIATGLLGIAALAAPAQPDAALAPVFARMDRAAAGFKGLTADVRHLTHTDFVNDDSVDTGTIKLKRPKPNDTRVLIQFTEPDPKSLYFQGKKLDIYYPRMQTVDEYDLGKNREIVDQYLLLGFGATSKELQNAYTIRLVGDETVAGQKATELELVPKSKDVLQQVKKFQLWIGEAGVPVQLKFYPSGQYVVFTYTNIKVNPDLPESELKLQIPKGTKKQFPQKGS